MFFDIGVGILVAIAAGLILDVDLSFWMVSWSIFFAVSPDIDFLYFFSRRGDTKRDHNHRDLIHYPILYLPIGTIIIWLIFGKIWGIIFLISSFLHFVHDSIGIGWGIKWLYPFSKKNYAFLYLYSGKVKKGLRKIVFSFDRESMNRNVEKHGDPNWVKNIYYKWHPIAIVEFGVFLLSVIILILYVKR